MAQTKKTARLAQKSPVKVVSSPKIPISNYFYLIAAIIVVIGLAIVSKFLIHPFNYYRTYVTPIKQNLELSPKFTPTPTQASQSAVKKVSLSPKSEATKAALATIPLSSGRSIRVPILYYHYIGNNPNPADKERDTLEVTPDLFEDQMKYLSQAGYNTISLDTLYAGLMGQTTLPPKPIVLTFDDGYIDFYLNAYQILRKYNFRATEFIPTGLMNQGYYLSWSQIQEMNASGLIYFEAHSVSHPNMTALSDSDLRNQIITSKQVLEAQTGKPVNWFAYPYGISNSRTWAAVKNAGFVGAVGTWSGDVESEGNLFDLPRVRVGSTWSGAQLAAHL